MVIGFGLAGALRLWVADEYIWLEVSEVCPDRYHIVEGVIDIIISVVGIINKYYWPRGGAAIGAGSLGRDL